METNGKKYPADLKVVLLGASNAGKTSLVSRYIEKKFTENVLTIGSSFVLKSWNSFKIAIWDTAGEERFRGLSKFYCRGAGGAILVFDLSDEDSFHSIRANFAPLLVSALPDCVCLVVGTKLDLIERVSVSNEPEMHELVKRRVSYEDGLFLAKQLNGAQHQAHIERLYLETSSLTGENVDQVFENLFELCLHTAAPSNATVQNSLTQSFQLSEPPISSTYCCRP